MTCENENHQAPKCSRTVSQLDSLMFASRWFLYPINFGLILALVIYVGKFGFELYSLIIDSPKLDTEQLMVAFLGLVDIAMVANLVVMIIQGGHHVFIRRLAIADECSRPQWLDHIDSGILKVKVALSIAGITLIRVLKDFVNIEHLDWDLVVHRMIIHAMCLGSALAMALIWRITHPAQPVHAGGSPVK